MRKFQAKNDGVEQSEGKVESNIRELKQHEIETK